MPRRKHVEPEPTERRRRGTGSIQILADGTIRARLPKRLDPKRTAKEFPPGHLSDAEAWLDGYLHPQPPMPVAVAPTTLETWAGSWWKTHIEAIHPPNTTKTYLHALRQLDVLYGLPIANVRPSMLQAVIAELNGRLDALTIQGIVGVWRRCLEAACNDGLIEKNPARSLTVPKATRAGVPKRYVTPAEAAALGNAIVGSRFEVAYAMLLGCGLRIGEVLGLGWANIDLANRRAWIQRQWTNSHWRDLPKGRNPHWVDLPEPVIAALSRRNDSQPPGSVLVMQSPHGGRPGRGRKRTRTRATGPQPWSCHVVRKELRAIVDGLKLDPLTPRAARRGLVTALLNGGVSPATVAGIVGHADPAVTLRRYAQDSQDGRDQAALVVRAYLGYRGPESVSETESAS